MTEAVSQALKTNSEEALMQEGPQLPSTNSNEKPRRNKRDPRVHANQYTHSESTVQICFH